MPKLRGTAAARPFELGGAPVEWLLERRRIVGWWALSRLVVLGAGLAIHWLRRPRGFFGRGTFRDPLGIFGSWDGRWYDEVARHGYLLVPGRQSDPAFFPLYPMILRAFHAAGIPILPASVVLSQVALLLGLLALYELGRQLLPQADAARAAVLAAVFPIGFVFSMEYPEAPVFALLALAGFFALRGRWIGSALFAATATLARPEGVLISIPIAVLAIRLWRALPQPARGRAVAAALAAPAALLSFPLYLGWTLHNPLAWEVAQRAWGRSFKTDGLVRLFTSFPAELHRHPWFVRDAAFVVVYLVLLAGARRAGVGWEWIAFGLLIVLLPLTTGSFESDARFGLLALPVYWGLALLTRRRWAEWLLIGASLVLLAAGTVTLPFAFP